jgi:hypothetical protein
MEFTSREQRLINRAGTSSTGNPRKVAVIALVLGGMNGFLQIAVGVIDLIHGTSGAGTRLGFGGFIIGFFLMLYAQVETAETARSVVRKLRSAGEGPGPEGE